MSQDIEREKEIAAGKRAANSYPVPPADLIAALRGEQEGWVSEVVEAFGELTLVVPREQIAFVGAHLKSAPGFEFDMLVGRASRSTTTSSPRSASIVCA